VRFDVLNTIPAISPTDAVCFEAAKGVFASDPETFIFVYGHTHNASLKRIDERVVINTGTWLKKLERVLARFRLLPSVYHPSFRLNYFRIGEDDGQIVIDYQRVHKAAPASFVSYNAWSPASHNATRWKIYREERSSGRSGQVLRTSR